MVETDLSSFSNEAYFPGPFVKRVIWYVVSLLIFRPAFPWPSKIKVLILRSFGAEVGTRVVIKPSLALKYPWFLSVGDNVWIGEQVWIDNLVKVTLGNNSCISQGAMLLTGNHNYAKSTFDLMAKPIYVGNGVWLGAKSVVCPGVRCESHAVLTVGSVATSDLEPFSIYSGIPAIKTKNREIFEG
ncbi:MAG: WcaF family extracellular polysaccharide biosynthesis acetyltransferase [Flavobacteriales bacterium]|nr:WcaF family extracellular polysaccharide biosynthesis acetyltransferase [Flavobacteriales bacterium]